MDGDKLIKACPKRIKTKADVRKFFRTLVYKGSLSVHPDTRFDQYVDRRTGKRLFTDRQAVILDGLMDQAFQAPGDVYDIGSEVLLGALEGKSKSTSHRYKR